MKKDGGDGLKDIATEKSRTLAIKVISLYKALCFQKKEFVMSKQILRSGTGIGANLAEAEYAISKRDYIHKKSISLKECSETLYWLGLLHDTSYIERETFEDLQTDCTEILKLLQSSIKTMKTNNK